MECPSTSRVATYVDKPVFIDDGSHLHLEGQRRIASESAWEQTQKDIPFVVYKAYGCRDTHHQRYSDGQDQINSNPQKTGETVRIINEALIRLVQRLFTSQPRLAIYAQSEVFRDSALRAPYTWFHHFEQEIRLFASKLGHHDPGVYLLLDYIGEQSDEIRQTVKEYLSRGEFQDWLIQYVYKPGELLVSHMESEPHVTALRSLLNGVPGDFGSRKLYNFMTSRISFDGSFRRVQQSANLLVPTDPSQTHRITDLKVYPLRFSGRDLQNFLLERGRKFYSCRDGRYVSYTADRTAFKGDFSESRYMVDVEAWRLLHEDKNEPVPERGDVVAADPDKPGFDDFLRQLPSTIYGFRMDDKSWIPLRVKDIQDVQWNVEAFEDLEADTETKTLIQAVVKHKLASDKSIDFVKGKGTGLIILLHGGPGTGKTLTAEGVAEIARKPLYPVTGGDVGTDPVKIEQYLEGVFYLGRRWECVVLLDEADVFLEKRSNDNMERNALVSVFLRRLEYYDGILILTTNRVGQFDEAFISRIQLALPYRPLTSVQRQQIWENFLRRLQAVGEPMESDAIRQNVPTLSKKDMNGRQIRNVIKTARQLARFEECPMTLEHLRRVIKVSQRFVDYMDEIEDGAEVTDGDKREINAREKSDR